jgi:hypothetical protein
MAPPDPALTLAALKRHGLEPSDEVSLRFSIEAPTTRAASALASELRVLEPHSVLVRPTAALRSARTWLVMMVTPAAPADVAVVFAWEHAVHAVLMAHPGSAVIGWEPVLP